MTASGRIIYRKWDAETGLAEIEEPFSSLEELVANCARHHEGMLIHRVVIAGIDDDGELRAITLGFQMITMVVK